MDNIQIFDRKKSSYHNEQVMGENALRFLYDQGWARRLLLPLFTRSKWTSALFGWLQKTKRSKRKVGKFIDQFQINSNEFRKPIDEFTSFNDFFIRQLKEEARPIDLGSARLVMPTDGRILTFQPFIEGEGNEEEGIFVKGEVFSLFELLGEDPTLYEKYRGGALMICRLAPIDYHRFHFPCDGMLTEPRLVGKQYFSVNPIALTKNIHALSRNKRFISELKTDQYGDMAYVVVGATNVSSVVWTAEFNKRYKKGDEAGYFQFGGSTVVLVFEPGRVEFDRDILSHTEQRIEVLEQLGQGIATLQS
ncbi:MAG: Phosphatidylserine decarboxylase proenzyme [Chlamydiia bacterium]|nr:Phosphatidylserine decarboxylase proenzyme [Chlamydiia bacterium]